MNVNCVFKSHVCGTTLLEACVALSLIMVSVAGCLSTFQMAIKIRKTVEFKTWALTQMESLADAVQRTVSGKALDLLLNAEKIRLEEWPDSCLSWKAQSAEQGYKICFSWTACDAQQHKIEFTVMPRGDFH
jgi:hypothetical protein